MTPRSRHTSFLLMCQVVLGTIFVSRVVLDGLNFSLAPLAGEVKSECLASPFSRGHPRGMILFAEARLGCQKDYVSVVLGMDRQANLLAYLPLNDLPGSTTYKELTGSGITYTSNIGATKVWSLLPSGRGRGTRLTSTFRIASQTAFSQNQRNIGCAFWFTMYSAPSVESPIVGDTLGGAATQSVSMSSASNGASAQAHLNLYDSVNGLQFSSVTTGSTAVGSQTNYWYIGRDGDNAVDPFDGAVQHMMLFPSSTTDQWCQYLWDEAQYLTCTTTLTLTITPPQTPTKSTSPTEEVSASGTSSPSHRTMSASTTLTKSFTEERSQSKTFSLSKPTMSLTVSRSISLSASASPTMSEATFSATGSRTLSITLSSSVSQTLSDRTLSISVSDPTMTASNTRQLTEPSRFRLVGQGFDSWSYATNGDITATVVQRPSSSYSFTANVSVYAMYGDFRDLADGDERMAATLVLYDELSRQPAPQRKQLCYGFPCKVTLSGPLLQQPNVFSFVFTFPAFKRFNPPPVRLHLTVIPRTQANALAPEPLQIKDPYPAFLSADFQLPFLTVAIQNVSKWTDVFVNLTLSSVDVPPTPIPSPWGRPILYLLNVSRSLRSPAGLVATGPQQALPIDLGPTVAELIRDFSANSASNGKIESPLLINLTYRATVRNAKDGTRASTRSYRSQVFVCRAGGLEILGIGIASLTEREYPNNESRYLVMGYINNVTLRLPQHPLEGSYTCALLHQPVGYPAGLAETIVETVTMRRLDACRVLCRFTSLKTVLLSRSPMLQWKISLAPQPASLVASAVSKSWGPLPLVYNLSVSVLNPREVRPLIRPMGNNNALQNWIFVGRSSVMRLTCFKVSLVDRSSGLTVPLVPNSVSSVDRIGKGQQYPYTTTIDQVTAATVSKSTDNWIFCGFTLSPYNPPSNPYALPLKQVRVTIPQPALFLPGLSSTHLTWSLLTNKSAMLHQVYCHRVSARVRQDSMSSRLWIENSQYTVDLSSTYPGAMDRTSISNPSSVFGFDSQCKDVTAVDKTDTTSTVAARRGRGTTNATLVIKNCSFELYTRAIPPASYGDLAKAGTLEFYFLDGRYQLLALQEAFPILSFANPPILPTKKVWVTSIQGCTDAYPQTGNCLPSVAGASQPTGSVVSNVAPTAPLVLTGFGFNSSMRLSFDSPDGLDSIPCTALTVVNSSVMICTEYTGFGSPRRVKISLMESPTVELTFLGPPTISASQTIGFTFRSLREGSCGRNAVTGVYCSGHGQCDPIEGKCICFSNDQLGYWTGSACEKCQPAFNSTKCVLPCPGPAARTEQEVCSGAGECFNSRCNCRAGFYGDACQLYCPGVGSPCSGHGTCDTSTGACICNSNSQDGYWDGPSYCSRCAAGWSGASCNLQCPVSPINNQVCSGTGVCLDGTCICPPRTCGSACHLNATQCDLCPKDGYFGNDCAQICPGGASLPCSGQGLCSQGRLGTGRCACLNGVGGSQCEIICPGGRDSPCSGHGFCDATTGTCRCSVGYGTPSCGARCFGAGTPQVCSGHGVCNDGAAGTGTCICVLGWTATDCNTTCLGGSTPCSLHGTCRTDGSCSCYADPVLGYYEGALCDQCVAGWVGPRCNQQCPRDLITGQPCTGHGACSLGPQLQASCRCFADDTKGHWTGETCQSCAVGWFGPQCLQQCPGGACNACSGHGTCADGALGSGRCRCYANSTVGYWSTVDCGDCLVDYFGSDCRSRCPTLDSSDGPKTCGGHGKCLGGVGGSGLCVCFFPFVPDGDGLCLECATGFFGPTCKPCPGVNLTDTDHTTSTTVQTVLPCQGVGTCDGGRSGSGTCRCNVGYGGDSCQYNCSTANGATCNGHGTCTETGCTCATNWTLGSDLACSDCDQDHYGANCSFQCPSCSSAVCDSGLSGTGTCRCPRGYWGSVCDRICPGGATTPCSLHGTCSDSAGTCQCTANLIQGYWQGATCNYCNPRFQSDNCTIRCPVNDEGTICSNRADCNNGQCSDCIARATDIESIYCGAACDIAGLSDCGSLCTTGYWGTACDQWCPGFDGVNSGTSCSGRGACGRDGRCFCDTGYGGSSCEFVCPTRTVNERPKTCSGNGRCIGQNLCKCIYGFSGVACDVVCALGSNGLPCGGLSQGICEASGTCRCVNGYVGDGCQFLCPNSTSTYQCGGHGICDKNGACVCYDSAGQGRFEGSECEKCQQFYYGEDCRSRCSLGTLRTSGKSCVCKATFGGADCGHQCPGAASEVGTCSGHGECQDGSDRTGTCTCDEGWYRADCSVGCSRSDCIVSGLVNPMCDSEGRCVCQRTSAGAFDGPTCEDCFLGYWGVFCSLRCQCNDHGGCERNTGTCQCFQDAARGHWSGVTCDRCSDGYIGASCRVKNVQMSRNPGRSTSAAVENPVDSLTKSVFFSDPVWSLWYVGSNPVTVFNATTEPARFVVRVVGMKNSERVLRMDIAPTNNSIIWIFTNSGQVYSVPRINPSTLSRIDEDEDTLNAEAVPNVVVNGSRRQATSLSTFNASLLANVTRVAVLYSARNGVTVTAYQNGFLVIVPIAVGSSSASASTTVLDLSTRFKLVAWAELSESSSVTGAELPAEVLLSGTGVDSTWLVATASLPGLSMESQFRYFNQSNVALSNCKPPSGSPVKSTCASAQRCIAYRTDEAKRPSQAFCLLTAASGPVMASFVVGDSAGVMRLVEQQIYVTPLLYVVTAMILDASVSGIAPTLLLALNAPQESSILLKILLNDTSVRGELRLGGDANTGSATSQRVVSSLSINSPNRELFAVVQTEFKTEILSINLFGIYNVVPDVIDSRGGTSVIIYGEGFNPQTGSLTWGSGNSTSTLNPTFAQVYCDFGTGQLQAARLLDEGTLLCEASSAKGSFSGCTVNYMDVQLRDSRRTSTTNVPVVRPTPVVLQASMTEDGAGFASAQYNRTITLVGYGFVDTPYATCRLVDSRGVTFVTIPGKPLNATAANCFLPALNQATRPPTYLVYSHDGQQFSDPLLPFAIVGTAATLDIFEPTVPTVKSLLQTLIPPVTVLVTDSKLNPLRGLDLESRPIRVAAYIQPVKPAELPQLASSLLSLENVSLRAIPLANSTAIAILSRAGTATFSRLALQDPPVTGLLTLEFSVVQPGLGTWIALSTAYITSGDPYALQLKEFSTKWRVGTTNEIALDPQPVAIVTDRAGNQILDRRLLPGEVTLEYSVDLPSAIDDSVSLRLQIVSVGRKLSASTDAVDPSFQFSGVKLRGIYGGTYALTLTAPFLQTYRTPAIPLQRCDAVAAYGRPGSFRCLPCPNGAICDGLNLLSVEADYWRASADAYTVYTCTDGACAASGCNDGYQGAKCSGCTAGFGKAGNSCVECFSSAINWVIIIVLVTVIIIGIFLFTLNAMGDPDTEIGKEKDMFPIVLKMLLTYLQVVSQAKDITDADFSLLQTLFQREEQISMITTDFPFVRCQFHLTFYDEFFLMNILPIVLAAIIIGLVSAWVFIRRMSAMMPNLDSEQRNPDLVGNAYRTKPGAGGTAGDTAVEGGSKTVTIELALEPERGVEEDGDQIRTFYSAEEERELEVRRNRRELLQEARVVDPSELIVDDDEFNDILLDISGYECTDEEKVMRRLRRLAPRTKELSGTSSSLHPQRLSVVNLDRRGSSAPNGGTADVSEDAMSERPTSAVLIEPNSSQSDASQERLTPSVGGGGKYGQSKGVAGQDDPSEKRNQMGFRTSFSWSLDGSRRRGGSVSMKPAEQLPADAPRISLTGNDEPDPLGASDFPSPSLPHSTTSLEELGAEVESPTSPSKVVLRGRNSSRLLSGSVVHATGRLPTGNLSATSLMLPKSPRTASPASPLLMLGDGQLHHVAERRRSRRLSCQPFASGASARPPFAEEQADYVGGTTALQRESKRTARRSVDLDRAQFEAEQERLLLERIRHRGPPSRFLEVAAVCLVVVLFLLYPNLIQTVSDMLQCEDVDFGDSAGVRSLLVVDRTIDCNSATYRQSRRIAIALLIVWGFGIPAFSIALVNIMQRLTLHNHEGAAHTLFFFMTGGVLPQFWYWEATAMARKAFLSMIVTLVPQARLKTYLAMWLMLLFFVLQVAVKPWRHKRLSHLETGSLLAILLTFNLLMLQPHIDPKTQQAAYYLVIIAVVTVNLLMTLAFLVMLSISAKQALQRLAHTRPQFAFLRPLFERTVDDERQKTERMQKELEDAQARINYLMPRDKFVEAAWELLKEASRSNGEETDVIYALTRFQRERQALLLELDSCDDEAAATDPQHGHSKGAKASYLRYLESELCLLQTASQWNARQVANDETQLDSFI